MERKIYVTFCLFVVILLTGSFGYYIIFNGRERLIDCIYMTLVTLSTVGYGEVLDVGNNDTAKIFTMVLMMSGIGILAYGVSLVTAFLVEGELTDILRRRRMDGKLTKLHDHFIVCGGGETGQHAVEELRVVGADVVVIEQDTSRLNTYAQNKVLYIEGDSTEDEVLLRAGIERAKGIIIALPSDKDNLFVTVTARQLNPKIRIVAKGIGDKMKEKLIKAGADSTVCPNFIGGLRLASVMIRPSVVVFLDMMLRDYKQTMRIEEIAIDEDSPLQNKTVANCGLKEKFNVLILAIVDSNQELNFNPPPNAVLKVDTKLIIIGISSNITQARKFARAQVKVDHETKI